MYYNASPWSTGVFGTAQDQLHTDSLHKEPDGAVENHSRVQIQLIAS